MGATIDGAVTTGRVLAHPPVLLPIVAVHRDSRAAINFTLSATAPEVLPLDADLATTSAAGGDVRIWRIDGVGRCAMEHGAGIDAPGVPADAVRSGRCQVIGSGATLRIFTLATSGVYTVELRTVASAAAPR